ncbi:MAG TPA: HEAT repeat domain-containing protein [Symbiobacteriaceae bacterium]|nr:HEAT repeat domain-containing protein [Symbiobacteriaceae bacterium]
MGNWTEVLLAVAVQAVIWLGLVVSLLLAYIVAHRLLDGYREKRLAPRRERYEELVVDLLVGDLEPLDLLRQVRRADRLLVEDLLLEYAAKFASDMRQRMAPLFQGIGAVARNRRRTRSWFWWRRADAARRLGLMAEEQISRSLRLLLQDRQAEVRIAAARALIELGSSQWLDDVIWRLNEPDTVSRLRVADVVLEAGAAAVPGLIRFVRQEANPRSAVVAIDMLGDLRAVEAEPVIMAAAGSEYVELRAAACRALGRLETPEALELLCSALQDRAWEVRNQAVRALGAIGDAQAAPFIVPMLHHDEIWGVYRSALALAAMPPEGIRLLQSELYRMQNDQTLAEDRRVRVLQEVLCQAGATRR